MPASGDWTAWDAEQMRAAVDYLEQSARPIADAGDTDRGRTRVKEMHGCTLCGCLS